MLATHGVGRLGLPAVAAPTPLGHRGRRLVRRMAIDAGMLGLGRGIGLPLVAPHTRRARLLPVRVVALRARTTVRRVAGPQGRVRELFVVAATARGSTRGGSMRLVAITARAVPRLQSRCGSFVATITSRLRHGRRAMCGVTLCALSLVGSPRLRHLLVAARAHHGAARSNEGVPPVAGLAPLVLVLRRQTRLGDHFVMTPLTTLERSARIPVRSVTSRTLDPVRARGAGELACCPRVARLAGNGPSSMNVVTASAVPMGGRRPGMPPEGPLMTASAALQAGRRRVRRVAVHAGIMTIAGTLANRGQLLAVAGPAAGIVSFPLVRPMAVGTVVVPQRQSHARAAHGACPPMALATLLRRESGCRMGRMTARAIPVACWGIARQNDPMASAARLPPLLVLGGLPVHAMANLAANVGVQRPRSDRVGRREPRTTGLFVRVTAFALCHQRGLLLLGCAPKLVATATDLGLFELVPMLLVQRDIVVTIQAHCRPNRTTLVQRLAVARQASRLSPPVVVSAVPRTPGDEPPLFVIHPVVTAAARARDHLAVGRDPNDLRHGRSPERHPQPRPVTLLATKCGVLAIGGGHQLRVHVTGRRTEACVVANSRSDGGVDHPAHDDRPKSAQRQQPLHSVRVPHQTP